MCPVGTLSAVSMGRQNDEAVIHFVIVAPLHLSPDTWAESDLTHPHMSAALSNFGFMKLSEKPNFQAVHTPITPF